ncbi:MAG TPA: hypothetical protein VFA59_08880 [Vicinamibacterales bacterium]|nr:hypothetical protein [Vicinamibacterales bacterium]
MRCRNCDTEIADKALICYKCGAPTTDAKYQPAEVRPRGGSRSGILASLIAMVILVLAALYMGRASANQTPRYVTYVFVAIAIVVVGLRAYARRR